MIFIMQNVNLQINAAHGWTRFREISSVEMKSKSVHERGIRNLQGRKGIGWETGKNLQTKGKLIEK